MLLKFYIIWENYHHNNTYRILNIYYDNNEINNKIYYL